MAVGTTLSNACLSRATSGLSRAGGVTLYAWVQLTSFLPDGYVLGWSESLGDNQSDELDCDNAGNLIFASSTGVGTWSNTPVANTPTNNWICCVIRWNNDTNVDFLYSTDGLTFISAVSDSTVAFAASVFMFGGVQTFFPIAGNMEYIRAFSSALSDPALVLELRSTVPVDASIWGNWPLNDHSNPGVSELVGTVGGRDLTLQNGTLSAAPTNAPIQPLSQSNAAAIAACF